ncbi:toll/interleukin-1 receptor domain-containing protein [Nitrogeniibacter aestuarii]|uniref:toll/interleukin-1 receptor domain-containing protein n=1 Tax=Nitrogeniibacter aestuarii TaxID=2815343 RepID=UPI001E43BD3B|nr:toll/interleukin-1 receptor domain-containing protein [Nitrogeniibacter aestuarii]
MGHIFISYRRDDSAGYAGRLEEALQAYFGPDAVFRDVDDLVPGMAFSSALDARIDAARVVLVLIGPGWLDADRDGVRRLEQADDYVRREVAQALASAKPVIPVLLGGAQLPAREALPAPLKGLVDRHAVCLDDSGWRDDVARLSGALAQWVPPAGHSRFPGAARWGVGLVVLLGALMLAWPHEPPFPSGAWETEVRYEWGPVVTERFVLTERGEQIIGWASFLGVPRPIVAASWSEGVLQFETRTHSQMGDEERSLHHRYLMQRDDTDRTWRMDYVIEGGFSPVKPMRLSLRYAGAEP